jgi:hypothetical protein
MRKANQLPNVLAKGFLDFQKPKKNFKVVTVRMERFGKTSFYRKNF